MAVIRVDSPSIIMVEGHQLNNEDMISSSPVKFIIGGVAMFIRLARSHQVVASGRIL